MARGGCRRCRSTCWWASAKHVIAFSRRSGPQGDDEAERVEVWTVRDGKADHYRGYPLEDGLAVLRATTAKASSSACRALLAFNRGDRAGFVEYFEADARSYAEQLPGQRLDDVRVLAETFDALVISATHHAGEPTGPRPLHLLNQLRRQPRAARHPPRDARGRGRGGAAAGPAPVDE